MEEKENNKREKGFNMFPSSTDFSKIKVGMKTLEDAILDLDSLKTKTGANNISKVKVIQTIEKNNYKEACQISDYFYKTNGMYQRLCKYLAMLYKYDNYCVPFIDSETIPQDKVLKEFYKVLRYLGQSNIRKICGDISLEVVRRGCCYVYIIDNKNIINLQYLPQNYCRSRYSIGQDKAIEFNMKYFDDEFKDINYRMKVLKLFPKEFQKGYLLFKEGKLKPDFSGDKNGWYLLDINKTYKFNLNDSDFPIFLPIINSLIDLEEAQDLDRKKVLQQLLKVLIQKLPMDKNGEILFDIDEARDIHNNAVNMLTRAVGVDVLTTFADVDVADMSSTSEVASADNLTRVERTVYNNAGVSNNVFNTTGNTALEKSILNDEAIMRDLILQLEDFLNKVIRPFNSSKKYHFKISMLQTTIYNYKDISKMYKEQVQIGYSKLLPQIAMGHSQDEILAEIHFEQEILHLSDIMIPPLSSNTMSGKNLGNSGQSSSNKTQVSLEENKGGRPELEDDQKTDKTLQNLEAIG